MGLITLGLGIFKVECFISTHFSQICSVMNNFLESFRSPFPSR